MQLLPQSARETRLQFPALPMRLRGAVACADKKEPLLTGGRAEKTKSGSGNIRILSSCYPATANPPALQVSYQLASAASVTVRLRPSACQALMSHCGLSSRNGYEVAGILAGHRREMSDSAGRVSQYCLDVTDVLPIESNDRSGSHIRVDEKAWGCVERMLLQLSGSQDKCKLAWYHTHPTQGIFFSHGDWESHLLFSRPYQFALVIDPSSMQAELFYWSDYERRLQGQTEYFSLKQETE